MAKINDCSGLETMEADVNAARKAKRLARKTLSEMVCIDPWFLATTENKEPF